MLCFTPCPADLTYGKLWKQVFIMQPRLGHSCVISIAWILSYKPQKNLLLCVPFHGVCSLHMWERRNKRELALYLSFLSRVRGFKNCLWKYRLWWERQTIIDVAFKKHEVSSPSASLPNGQLPAAAACEFGILASTVLKCCGIKLLFLMLRGFLMLSMVVFPRTLKTRFWLILLEAKDYWSAVWSLARTYTICNQLKFFWSCS